MKLNYVTQLCAIILCLGVLPGCGGDNKKGTKYHKESTKKGMHHKKESNTTKKPMKKEHHTEK